MPSAARLTFERHLLKDVHELMDTHKATYGGKRGKPKSALTRSGVFLLCAAWELYVEEAAREAVNHILAAVDAPSALPQRMQETLAAEIRNRSEEFALRMAGDGWKDIARQIVVDRTSALNTPSAQKIIDMYKDCLGVELGPLLGPKAKKIQDFISKRGAIAHSGAKAGRVSIKSLTSDYEFICSVVDELDNALVGLIRDVSGFRPWNKRRKK